MSAAAASARWAVLAVLATGCATPKPPSDTVTERRITPPTDVNVEAPDAGLPVEALFGRELARLGEQRFTVGDAELRAEAAAPVKVVRDDANGSFVVTVPLGTEQDLSCFAYDRPVDVATALSLLIESVRKQYSVVAVRPFALDVVEQVPALFVEVVYVVEQPAGRRVGSLKLMAVSSETAPVSCLHDEPGYTATFRRVATSFASALGRSRAFAAPPQRYRTIAVVSLAGAPVGFVRSNWLKKSDGTMVFFTVASRFVPRSAADYLAEDSATVTEADATGIVRRRRSFVSGNGVRTLELDLVQQKGARYRYSGEVSGKPVSGTLETRDPHGLPSERIVLQRVREELLAGRARAVTYERYAPEVTPSAFESVSLTVGEGGAATLEHGGVKRPVVLDANGDLRRVELSAGPLTLVTEQVFVDGAP